MDDEQRLSARTSSRMSRKHYPHKPLAVIVTMVMMWPMEVVMALFMAIE